MEVKNYLLLIVGLVLISAHVNEKNNFMMLQSQENNESVISKFNFSKSLWVISFHSFIIFLALREAKISMINVHIFFNVSYTISVDNIVLVDAFMYFTLAAHFFIYCQSSFTEQFSPTKGMKF